VMVAASANDDERVSVTVKEVGMTKSTPTTSTSALATGFPSDTEYELTSPPPVFACWTRAEAAWAGTAKDTKATASTSNVTMPAAKDLPFFLPNDFLKDSGSKNDHTCDDVL
jgi:hypothetical protein